MTLRDAFKMGDVVLDGLEMIEKFTNVGGDRAEAALAATRAAIGALRDGLDGKVKPQETLARIEALHNQLAATDSAADLALRKKFPGQ